MIQPIGMEIDSKEIKGLSPGLSRGIDFSIFLLNIIAGLCPTGETHTDISLPFQTGEKNELESQDGAEKKDMQEKPDKDTKVMECINIPVKEHISEGGEEIKSMGSDAEDQPLIEDSTDSKNKLKPQDKSDKDTKGMDAMNAPARDHVDHVKHQIRFVDPDTLQQPLIEDPADSKDNLKPQDKLVKEKSSKIDVKDKQDKFFTAFTQEQKTDKDKIKPPEHIKDKDKVEPEKDSSCQDYKKVSKEESPIDNMRPKNRIKDGQKLYKIIHKANDDNIKVKWESEINNKYGDNNNKPAVKPEQGINNIAIRTEDHTKKTTPVLKETIEIKGATLDVGPKSSLHYQHPADGHVKTEHIDIDRADLIRQLTENIQFHANKGGKEELIVNLKPEFLGRLKIRLISENGHIKIDLITENHIARDTINSHLPALQQVLIEQGLPVQEISLFISWQGQGYPENRRLIEYKPRTSYMSSRDVGSTIGPASSHRKVEEIEDAGCFDYWA